MKISKLHTRITKIMKHIRIICEFQGNQRNHRIPHENLENLKNLELMKENHEKKENIQL